MIVVTPAYIILSNKLFDGNRHSIHDFLTGRYHNQDHVPQVQEFTNLRTAITESLNDNPQHASAIRFLTLSLICESKFIAGFPEIQNIFSEILASEPTLANDNDESGNVLVVKATVYLQPSLLKLLKQNGANMRYPTPLNPPVEEDPTSVKKFIYAGETAVHACIRRITPSISPFITPVDFDTSVDVMSLVIGDYSRLELYDFMQRNSLDSPEVSAVINKIKLLEDVMLALATPRTIRFKKNGTKNAPDLRDFLDKDGNSDMTRQLISYLKPNM